MIRLLVLLAILYGGAEDLFDGAYAVRSLFRDQDAGFHPDFLAAFLGLLVVISVPVALSLGEP